MAPLNILYVAAAGKIGGGNRSLLTLIDGLMPGRYRAHVVLPELGPMADAVAERRLDWAVVRHDRWSAKYWPVDLLGRVWDYYRAMQNWKIDLLHTNTLGGYRGAGLAATLARIPKVCHARFYENHGGYRHAMTTQPDVLILNSHQMHRSFLPLVRATTPNTRCEVVHNAVDLDRFRPADRPDPALLESLRVQPGQPTVGIVGNLQEVKGHRYFLEMAARISRRDPRAVFLVLGDDIQTGGAFRTHLETLARELRVHDRVRFLGFRDDVPAVIQAMDVVVCPSLEEPFGRVVVEAGACAKPVVASRVGGIPEIIVDGQTGILVAPADADALAHAVEPLLAEPTRATRIGQAARRHVVKRFGKDQHVARILSIYADVLHKRGARRTRQAAACAPVGAPVASVGSAP